MKDYVKEGPPPAMSSARCPECGARLRYRRWDMQDQATLDEYACGQTLTFYEGKPPRQTSYSSCSNSAPEKARVRALYEIITGFDKVLKASADYDGEHPGWRVRDRLSQMQLGMDSMFMRDLPDWFKAALAERKAPTGSATPKSEVDFRAGYALGFSDGVKRAADPGLAVWRQGPRWVQYRDSLCRFCNQPVDDPLADHQPGEGCRKDMP